MALCLTVTGWGFPATLDAQRDGVTDPPRLQVALHAGFSLREGQTTTRFAEDMVQAGGRVTLHRGLAPRPWVQLDGFVRPDLVCEPGFACEAEGVLLRAGFLLPLSDERRGAAFQPHLLGGMGAGFVPEARFSYLIGLGGAWRAHRRLAPTFEARWERVPGLRNVIILAAGLRVGLR